MWLQYFNKALLWIRLDLLLLNKIQETVNPHAEEVKSLASHPDVDQHAAPENINPKLELSDKPSEPMKLPGIETFTADSGLGGKNPILS